MLDNGISIHCILSQFIPRKNNRVLIITIIASVVQIGRHRAATNTQDHKADTTGI